MDIDWTLEDIGSWVNCSLHGDKRVSFTDLAIDSRTLASAESTLFIALEGAQHDGHDYLSELYKRGVRAFMVSRLPHLPDFSGAGFCLVEDTLSGLQNLAAGRRRNFEGNVVAITGSNGKTIVKEWMYQCLNEHYYVHRSPKSYNSQVGVPLSVWQTGKDHDLAIIEAGISQPGEMTKLNEIIQPRFGLFTNLGTAHQENFSSLEDKLDEKLLLFDSCEKIFYRSDLKIGARPLRSFLTAKHGELIDWSLGGTAKYQYTILNRSKGRTGLMAQLSSEEYEFSLPFNDDASIENALHALTFSLDAGLPAKEAFRRIGNLEPVSMRLEILQGIQGSVIINDAYNSDIGGLSAALDLVNQQDPGKEKVVILSDLLQSGLEEQELYRQISDLIDLKKIDHFIGIGTALMKHRECFSKTSRFFTDTVDFFSRMDMSFFRNRTILVKGSRKFGFERISSELQLKTHQTVLEIDLNAVINNLNYYRSLLEEGTRTMVMVKALSYGSGHLEIANLLQFHQVDYLAVAFIDEGIELRKSGIHLPIMVLNPDPGAFSQMLDYQLEPEIFSFDGLKDLYESIHYRGIKSYPIHIKLDTGMHRLGLQESELESLIPLLGKDEFKIVSVFTHLAASGDEKHDIFTRNQFSEFERFTDHLSKSLGTSFLKHVLNSAGIDRFPEAQYDMVRLGIGLHGIGAARDLVPAGTFKTSVSQVRLVPKGESIGYSRGEFTTRDSLIATLPVGYADGMNRRLGCGAGTVWIQGQQVPTIGHICMDMTMIDVSGLAVRAGDEVEIFGKNQPVSSMAEQAETIPYEILTSVPERVKRVYLQE